VSELNLDLARRTFEAFAERDLAALRELMHPDVEFLPVTANITTGGEPYRGHEGMARYFEDIARVWADLRVFPDELIDSGEAVVVLGRVRGRGGGMIMNRPSGWLLRMRDGKIVSGRVYGSHAEALAAARALRD
jgi:ketosteroid isomerase-like protein